MSFELYGAIFTWFLLSSFSFSLDSLTEKEISHLDAPEMMTTQESFLDILTNWPTDVAGSLVWDEQVRRKVKETKITEHELNRKRSELLLPGSRLTLSENETSHIPLLLVQQPGCLGKYLAWRVIAHGQRLDSPRLATKASHSNFYQLQQRFSRTCFLVIIYSGCC